MKRMFSLATLGLLLLLGAAHTPAVPAARGTATAAGCCKYDCCDGSCCGKGCCSVCCADGKTCCPADCCGSCCK